MGKNNALSRLVFRYYIGPHMQCIILCAGFATRLHPLTLNQPKHLLPVGKSCVLDVAIERLAEVGFSEVVVVCNHRFAAHFDQWQRQVSSPVKVHLFDNGVKRSHRRKGSTGDLHLVLESLDIHQDFLVLHGDNLFTFHLQPILDAFHNKGNILATYDVQNLERARRGAQITCDAQGRIIDLVEKPAVPDSTRVSIGIYVMRAEIRHQISRYHSAGLPSDRTGDLMAWLRKHVALYTYDIPTKAGTWFDIGTPDDFQQAVEFMTRAGGP